MAQKSEEKNFVLSEIQGYLDVPQHVLIHLCEKKVIIPDCSDTEGKGRFRLFSKRNLLEFVIVLHIRKFQIPIVMTRHIIFMLRKFVDKVAHKMNSFTLESLGKNSNVELVVYVENGDHLIFSLQGGPNPIFLKYPMNKPGDKKRAVQFIILKELSNTFSSRLEMISQG